MIIDNAKTGAIINLLIKYWTLDINKGNANM